MPFVSRKENHQKSSQKFNQVIITMKKKYGCNK